jgi:hypothetical protein
VEEHGHKLDNDNGEEEEHKDDTDRLQVEVLFRDDDLEIKYNKLKETQSQSVSIINYYYNKFAEARKTTGKIREALKQVQR